MKIEELAPATLSNQEIADLVLLEEKLNEGDAKIYLIAIKQK